MSGILVSMVLVGVLCKFILMLFCINMWNNFALCCIISHMKAKHIPIRFYTMFFRTLAVLLAVTALVVSLYTAVLNREFRKKYFYQMNESGFEAMSRSRSSLDSIISQERNRMRGIFQRSEAKTILTAGNHLTEENTIPMLLALSSAVTGDSYAYEAMLYLPRAGRVLMSDQRIVSADESRYLTVLKNEADSLVVRDDGIFLIERFPEHKPLGILVLRLEKRPLYQAAFSEVGWQENYSRIYVFASGTPVFAAVLPYPKEKELDVRAEMSSDGERHALGSSGTAGSGTPAEDRRIFEAAGGSCIQVLTGDKYGLMFLRFMDMPRLNPLGQTPGIVVILLLTLLITAAAALFLLRTVFRPFGAVLSDILGSRPLRGESIRSGSANEIELIRNVVEDDHEQQEKLRKMLLTARESVQSGLFRELLNSDIVPEADLDWIREQLGHLESPFRADGMYQVIALWHAQPVGGGDSQVTEHMFREECAELTAGFFDGKALSFSVSPSGQVAPVILSRNPAGGFPQVPSGVVVSESDILAYLQKVQELAGKYRFRFAAGVSGTAEGIAALPAVGRVALEDLRRRLYGGAAEESHEEPDEDSAGMAEEEGKIALSPDAEADLAGALRALDAIAEAALSDHVPVKELDARMDGLIGQVTTADPVFGAPILLSLMDRMTERLVQYRIPVSAEAARQRRELSENRSPISREDSRIFGAEAFFREALENIRKTGQGSQLRYVESARSLIRERYSDPTLSLELLAEEIGVTPQYLSRLFNRFEKAGFIGYVAETRLSQAKALLASTDLPASEIGLRTGFTSAQSFSRVFRRYEGITPGQYRKQQKESGGEGR